MIKRVNNLLFLLEMLPERVQCSSPNHFERRSGGELRGFLS
jgi:hypothetical protein